jgi:hypothetical protein
LSSDDREVEVEVEVELGELEDEDPFPGKKRSDGLRISGAADLEDDAIPQRAPRVRRNDEEIAEMKLDEFLR